MGMNNEQAMILIHQNFSVKKKKKIDHHKLRKTKNKMKNLYILTK